MLVIVGVGLTALEQITLEGVDALRRADRAYVMRDAAAWSGFASEFGTEVVDLGPLYEEGLNRAEVYGRVGEAVLDGVRSGGSCVYLAQGSPLLLDSIVAGLIERAVREDVGLRVIPGVSCIDTILTELVTDIGSCGLQCYEASEFVRRRPVIDVRVPLLLFQPHVVNDPTVRVGRGSNRAGVGLLRDVLAGLYGEDQGWIIVGSPPTSASAPVYAAGCVGRLEEFGDDLRRGSLFVPGSWWRPVVGREDLVRSRGAGERRDC